LRPEVFYRIVFLRRGIGPAVFLSAETARAVIPGRNDKIFASFSDFSLFPACIFILA